MRIAIVNATDRLVGGAERYIDESIPHLLSSGHEIALCVPQKYPANLSRAAHDDPLRLIGAGTGTLHYLVGVDALVAWNPNVIFVHCLLPKMLEERLLSIAPSVLFAHDYVRTCISGSKTLHDPNAHPCSRRLGPGCLAHYYPHRCGGLNPVTMARNYLRGRDALTRLRRYGAVVTFSAHMRAEYDRNAKGEANVVLIPPFTTVPPANGLIASPRGQPLAGPAWIGLGNQVYPRDAHIGFLGRLEKEKGVDLLIAAMPLAADELGHRINLTIAGRGRQLASLEGLARELMTDRKDIRIKFTNWLTGPSLDQFFERLDILVIPSTWPEPFALVGLEAAARRVPAVAFSVGGLTDWLRDGLNGHLASGEPPSSAGLASAMVSALRDPLHLLELRAATVELCSEYTAARHHGLLLNLAHRIADSISSRDHATERFGLH